MQNEAVEIDVREILAEGRSPLPLIMNTVSSLEPGQRLRLLTAWEPEPLYELLSNLGFEREARQESEELWIIEFRRDGDGPPAGAFSPPFRL